MCCMLKYHTWRPIRTPNQHSRSMYQQHKRVTRKFELASSSNTSAPDPLPQCEPSARHAKESALAWIAPVPHHNCPQMLKCSHANSQGQISLGLKKTPPITRTTHTPKASQTKQARKSRKWLCHTRVLMSTTGAGASAERVKLCANPMQQYRLTKTAN